MCPVLTYLCICNGDVHDNLRCVDMYGHLQIKYNAKLQNCAMEKYVFKTGRAADAAVRIYRKIEDSTIGAYRKIEASVVRAYRTVKSRTARMYRWIEACTVRMYRKIESRFVYRFLISEGK